MSNSSVAAEAGEKELYWWDTASIASERLRFREMLQERHPSPDEVWWAWLKFFAVANAKGLALPAAQSLALLVEKIRREGRSVEQVVSRSSLGALSRVSFRALMALAEDPGIPVGVIEAVATQVDGLFVAEGCSSSDRAAIRLAIAPRLGRHASPGDLLSLEEAWRKIQDHFEERRRAGKTSSSDSEADSEGVDSFKMICSAAAGQMYMEALVEVGREGDAVECLWQALEREPCITLCGLAPQGLLCLGMELFWRVGNVAGARQMHDRLALVAPLSHAWLQPAGARCAYLARTGQHALAAELRSDAARLWSHPDTSAWHRLHFHHGAALSLSLARRDAAPEADAADESYHREAFLTLLNAFDKRNGNDAVARRLQLDSDSPP